MRNFKTLVVWQKAHQLALDVYHVTKSFPKTEIYGLTSQIRRASTSIPMNIAEGCGRDSAADFARFLSIAMGSASELEYQFLLTHDLGLVDSQQYAQLNGLLLEVKRMLNSFIRKLKADR